MQDARRIDELTAASIAMLKQLWRRQHQPVEQHPHHRFFVETIEKTWRRVHEAAHQGRQEKQLLARIGRMAAGGVILSGHTMWVPIDGQHGIRSRSFLPSMAESYMGAVHPT